MEKHIEADSQFQVFLKDFHTAFGIEYPSQVLTEQREILATSIRIDAIVTFDDDFFFTKLSECIFPWLLTRDGGSETGKDKRTTQKAYRTPSARW